MTVCEKEQTRRFPVNPMIPRWLGCKGDGPRRTEFFANRGRAAPGMAVCEESGFSAGIGLNEIKDLERHLGLVFANHPYRKAGEEVCEAAEFE